MQLAFPSLSDLRKKAAEKASSQPLAFCLQHGLKRPVVNQSISEYLEIHYDLCEWSCKLDMGPLESALVPFVLVSWCWLGYFFIDLCCECFIAFGRIRIVTSSFTLPRPLYATIRNQLLGLQGSQNMPAGERRLTESPWFGQTKDLHGAEGAAYLHAD